MKKQEVIVEIHNGIAEVTKKPKNVVVEVRDYDTDGADETETKFMVNENGKRYILHSFGRI